jgi:hypothetical protein
MDDYPAADPIPDPDIADARYGTLMDYLSNSREMREVATSSLRQAMWAGSGALVGGFVLGSVGGLVGGIAGSLVGFARSPSYDGMLVQLCKLNVEQRNILLTRVGEILIAAGATAQGMDSTDAFRDALIAYASQRTVREGLWNACIESLQQ